MANARDGDMRLCRACRPWLGCLQSSIWRRSPGHGYRGPCLGLSDTLTDCALTKRVKFPQTSPIPKHPTCGTWSIIAGSGPEIYTRTPERIQKVGQPTLDSNTPWCRFAQSVPAFWICPGAWVPSIFSRVTGLKGGTIQFRGLLGTAPIRLFL